MEKLEIYSALLKATGLLKAYQNQYPADVTEKTLKELQIVIEKLEKEIE